MASDSWAPESAVLQGLGQKVESSRSMTSLCNEGQLGWRVLVMGHLLLPAWWSPSQEPFLLCLM